VPKQKAPNLYPWHRKTGMAFRDWLRVSSGFPAKDPISLMEIDAAIQEGFACGQNDWHEAMRLCIASLLRRGWRPMLYDKEFGTWEWTDRFNGLDEPGDGSPECIAGATVASWVAFGDSGGAEDLRFATRLPTAEIGFPWNSAALAKFH
jgi:hypothetical protein